MQKKTLMALGALAALGLLAFLTMRAPEKGTKVGARPRPFPAFKTTDVAEVDLSSKDKEHVVIHKDGAFWKITKPSAFSADQITVKNTIDMLEKMSFADVITESPGKFGEMEVSDDKGAHVIAKDGSGKVLMDAWLGKSVGGFTMLRPTGKNEVWQTAGIQKYAFARELGQWRDHSVFDFKAEDTTRLSIEAPGAGKLVLDRIPPPDNKGEAKWKVVETSAKVDPLDDSTANQLLGQMMNLRAASFEEKQKAADVGLMPPRLVVTATVKGAAQTLLVGNIKGDDCWVQVAGNPQIYLIQKWAGEKLAQTPANFRDKTLIKAKDDVVGLDVTFGGESWSVKHEAAGWKLSKGDADEGKVKAMLSVFDEIKGASFAFGLTPATSGLDKPTGTAAVHLRDKSTVTIKVGALKDDSYYVQRAGSPDILVVKKYTIDRFLKKSGDLTPTKAPPGK